MAQPSSSTPADGKTTSVRTDTLAGSTMLILALTPLQRLVGIGRAIAVAALLDPAELGQWDLAFAFLSLSAPLAVLGLPGSFGRYVERYAQLGQLRTLLRRTIGFSAALGGLFMAAVVIARPTFSTIIFGIPGRESLVLMVAAVLGTVIVCNFLGSLLSALRLYRAFTAQQFAFSILFALLSIVLVLCWKQSVMAIVVAYGGASLLTAAGSALSIGRVWRGLPQDSDRITHWNLWSTLLPFSMCVWLTDVATNLLYMMDRYMLVHYSSASSHEVLGWVGQYHCARIVPNVLTTVAYMGAAMLTPHLAQKWEAGLRETVAKDLRFILKLASLTLTLASVAFLLLAEIGLGLGLAHKYAQSVAVLPGALLCGVWLGLVGIAQNYTWCTERAWSSCLVLVPGIVLNVLASFFLVPRFGLYGCVMAAVAAHLVVVVLTLVTNRGLGLRWNRTTAMIVLLPAALMLGGCWGSLLVLVALAAVARSELFFNREEKAVLVEHYRQNLHKILRVFQTQLRRRGEAAFHDVPALEHSAAQ